MRHPVHFMLAAGVGLLSAFAVHSGSIQMPQGGYHPDPAGMFLPELILGSPDEDIFGSGFESWILVETVSSYDDLDEGFLGSSAHYRGVRYLEVNEVSGYWPGPENKPFGPGSIFAGGLGNQFVVEDASLLFGDFPEFGSAPNVLTFGEVFVPGENLSLGPLASAWMGLDRVAYSVSMALVHYENGPWGGIEIHLDAYLGEDLVGSDLLTITSKDPDERDNLAVASLAIDAGPFDRLHLYAVRQSDGAYTAPRVMIDDLRLGRIVEAALRQSNYDDLDEGFLGTSAHYNGVHYVEVNEVHGYWPGPDNEPFVPGPITDGGLGNEFIVEDASLMFKDLPDFGSAPNVLTFGQMYVPGPNLSLGALASAQLALDAPAYAASMALVYYENGPWGGIEIHLDAFLGDEWVGSDSLTITSDDPDDRDNLATTTLSVDGGAFDRLHLYAIRQSDGAYTAPRVMIDNLDLLQAH